MTTFTRLFVSILTIILVASPFINDSESAEIVSYEFTYPGNMEDLYKPTQTASGVSASEYDFNSDASSVTGWSGSGGNPGAVFYGSTTLNSTESYMSFSLTAEDGYALGVDEIKFDSKRNMDGATSYDIKYSTDTSFSSIGSGSLSGTSYENISADNSGSTISVDSGDTIKFRIYGGGWSGTDHTSEDSYWYHDNVKVNGAVVPEPMSAMLFLLIGVTAVSAIRIKLRIKE